MTAALMEEWRKGFNERMRQQKRSILLFLDNATCHPHLELSIVQLAWFPPNTTSVTQPMDQGVINCVKVNYWKLVMQSLIVNMELSSSASELAHSIYVLDALIWITEAVKQVLPETVKSCFQKAKFMLGVNEDVEINSNNTKNLQEALNTANFGNIRAEDYVNLDMDVATEADLNEKTSLLRSISKQRNKIKSYSQKKKSPITESSVKTYSDALKQLKGLETFAVTRNDSDLFKTISRARMIENRAYESTSYN
jgi:hypothetical protein